MVATGGPLTLGIAAGVGGGPMSQAGHQYQSTVALAEAALGKISALGQSADPRSFALWFKYASGESGLLSAAINARLAAHNGKLTANDIEELHDAHIAPSRAHHKSNRVGARMAVGIDQILGAVGTASESSSAFSRKLSSATQQLTTTQDRDDLRAVINALTQATRELTDTNSKLQTQLQAMSEEIAQLRREIVELRAESQTDPLTGIGNRQFFNAALDRLITESRAANEPLTLLLADVDCIKLINKNYGNIVGDRVLRFIAMVIKQAITGRDVAARFDDDAFAIILPKSSLPPGIRLAEQLRQSVLKCELVRRTTGEKARLTLSVGVATLDKGLTSHGLVEAAEMCLHAAKRSGRNCVISEADDKLFAAAMNGPAPPPTLRLVPR
jgi:diguanylate cyclase